MGGSTSQGAARLLIILDRLGNSVTGHPSVTGAVRCLQSLTKFEKFDFWVRNPDYLADELLFEFVQGTRSFDEVSPHVVRMLSGEAPTFHAYRMSRYLYGAYERIDNPLSILKAYGHITHIRADKSNPRSRRDYFMLESGLDALKALRADIPSLGWYDLQADAIRLLTDIDTGADARRRQYLQPEYEAAQNGGLIPAITDRVRDRAIALGFDIEV
jgi:hypothetical protein